jgi:hypothetical protein
VTRPDGPMVTCVRPLDKREALCGRLPGGDLRCAVGDGPYLEAYRDRVTCPDCLHVLNPPPVVLEGQQTRW